MRETNSVERKLKRGGLLLIFLLITSMSSKTYSDTGWYVVPVEMTKTDGNIELGFLNLFVNKIVGVETRSNMKARVQIQGEGWDSLGVFIIPVVVGRVDPETLRVDTLITFNIGYAFGEMEILEITDRGPRLSIKFDNRCLELKDVTCFISGGVDSLRVATRVWTSPPYHFYRDEHKQMPLSELKRIRTIGEVLFIPYNPGD